MSALSGVILAIDGFVTKLGLAGVDAGAQFKTGLTTEMSTALVPITDFITEAVAAWVVFAGEATTQGTAAGTNFKTAITPGFNESKTLITNNTRDMRTTLNTFATDAGTAGKKAGTDFSKGISDGVSSAVRAAQTGRSQMITALTLPSMYASGADVGNSLGEGMAAGIRNQIEAVASAAASLVTAALNAARSAADSNSPSRKTMEQGRDIARGMEIGIERGTPAVIAAFGDIIPYGDFNAARQFGNMPVSNGAPVSHYTILALKSEEWLDMVQAAETGRDFANEFPYTLGGRR
jgi:hypothetical protein